MFYRDYLHLIANFCATVLKLPLKKSFLKTPNAKTNLELESINEMKLTMKFYLCLHYFFEI